ncbi:MAG: 3-isopropylmalate dehydratase small subunit [Thermoleophilia bacterium]|nr:3-isopropylmalate dehydratase small subunit [Thermoleophilia bacterium]
MRAFTRTTGRVAVLDRPDVDTDQIVPKQFLKRIERTGWADALFFDWRRDPDFELNNPAFTGARILLAGRNFGCGSSREHAPWALQDYGFDVVVAPSFADIFVSNCIQIGLVPIVLPQERVRELMALVDREHGASMTVDLEQQTITAPGGEVLHFPFDASQRHRLLNGLDDIGITLTREAEIAAYETARPAPIDTLALS